MTRVLHLDSGRVYRGGQRQVRLLAAGQGRGGEVEPRVLACDGRLRGELAAAGVEVSRWAGPASPRGFAQVRAAVREFRPDIVHVHGSRAHGAAILAARGMPLVIHRRIDDPPRDRALTRAKYRHGTFVCVSDAVAAVLAAAGVPGERLTVVPSAVPIPDPAPARPSPSSPLRLVAAGALVPHKGHDVLLEALAGVTEPVTLDLFGDGPRLHTLRERAAAAGLSAIARFHPFPATQATGERPEAPTLAGRGPQSGRQRPETPTLAARGPQSGRQRPETPTLAARVGLGGQNRLPNPTLAPWADLFVHPSRTEGLGTAVLDAMAAGLPVVASAAGGLPELVIPGVTGWLVPPDDPAALAAALDAAARLARTDPVAFAALGAAGRARVLARHSVPAMLAGVRAVYDRVAGFSG